MADTIQGHEAVGGATKRGAPDQSVKVPDGVRAASERANALVQQAKEAKAANAAAGTDQPIGATARPPVPNSPPSGVIVENFDPHNPRPPEPGDPRLTTVQSQTTAPPAPTPPTPQTPEDWEHQFRSLKGRYDREAEEKRRLNQQIVDMQRLMAQVVPAANNEGSGVRFNVQPPPPGRRVTQKEIDEFGQELMDVVGRRAAEVYEPLLAQVANELQQVKRQVGGVQNTVVYDARVKMYEDLAKEVPNWDAINNSPQFGAWLDQIDPISRQTRRSFLNAAHNSNLTGQVVDIFRGFLSDVAVRQPANGAGQQPGNGAVTHMGNPTTPQVDLMQFAAPGRAKTGQTNVPPEKPIFNATDVTQFYRDRTAGRYAGREAEAAAIEAALFAAGNEGRIIRR
jgi:hypothetical protein